MVLFYGCYIKRSVEYQLLQCINDRTDIISVSFILTRFWSLISFVRIDFNAHFKDVEVSIQ